MTAWEETEPTASKIQNLDFEYVALEAAIEAVDAIVAEGDRARTPAKQQAWTNLAEDLGPRIAAVIVSIAAGGPTEAVLDELIERGSK